MALTNYVERFISISNLQSFWSHAKTYIADVMLKDYAKSADVTSSLTEVNSEIARVEGLFANYYNKTDIEGKVSEINTEIGKKLATDTFNTEIAKYSTTTQVEGLIATAQAADKALWEAADADLKAELEGQIAAVAHLKLEKVDTLPTEGQKSDVIYLLPEVGATGTFVEYIWIDGAWERIGTTAADFSNYYTTDQVDGFVTTINASIAATNTKIGEVKIDDGEGEKTATVAEAIDYLEAAVKNAVAGGVNSVLLKNTDNGTSLEASGAGAVEIDIKALVEGYATDTDLSTAQTNLTSEIDRVEGLVTAHVDEVEEWAGSIKFAEESQIAALFA